MIKRNVLRLLGVFSLFTVPSRSQTVYIIKADTKYHLISCKLLHQNKMTIDLQDASAKGYRACSFCHPAQDITGNTLKQLHLDEKADPETGGTVATNSPSTPSASQYVGKHSVRQNKRKTQ